MDCVIGVGDLGISKPWQAVASEYDFAVTRAVVNRHDEVS